MVVERKGEKGRGARRGCAGRVAALQVTDEVWRRARGRKGN